MFRSLEAARGSYACFPNQVMDTLPPNGQRLRVFGFNLVLAKTAPNEITSVQYCSSSAMSVYLKQDIQMYFIQLRLRKARALHYAFLFNKKQIH